ncbi:PR domain zinc finger protein 13 like protein [Argiope bruennichi]|uniref:PR domain zinc finger protein 13 like protein n=1 Tax=Argiope bruennichi TaxID=94029 RepID=A0A8T0FIE9_ARGBR|nr:PR domain zinc finger protein 13 like protein [Argiope bruennichi]
MSSSVTAVCDIPEGTSSLPGVGDIAIQRLLEKSATKKFHFHVELIDGFLNIVEKQVCPKWACLIAIAKNCHEQNVELTQSPGGLILRMTKAVKASEELFIWMGADLLSQLEFPFLTPINIKGNQAYHCHKCSRIFQNPNPLKVHLFFQCNFLESRDSPSILKEAFQLENSMPFSTLPTAESEMPLYVGLANSRALQSLNSISALEHAKHFYKGNDASQESTSSNNMWGDYSLSSTSGHVCGYCGKVYSRKYGLKIHVRTHTGFKPLKCRYCFRPFSDPSNLNKHIRLHSESYTPYRCSICGKILVRRRDLQRHINSRHTEDSKNDIQNILKKV